MEGACEANHFMTPQGTAQWRSLGPTLIVSPYIVIALIDGFYKGQLATWPAVFWAHDATSKVLLPGLCMYLLHYTFNIRPQNYGLRVRGSLRIIDLLGLSALCTILLLIYFPVFYTAQRVFQAPADIVGFRSMLPTNEMRILGALYLSSSAAFFEDVFYIGIVGYVLGQNVSRKSYPYLLVVISSLLAFSTHWENGFADQIAVAVTQAVACFLYVRIGTLWPLITAHFVTDLMVFM